MMKLFSYFDERAALRKRIDDLEFELKVAKSAAEATLTSFEDYRRTSINKLAEVSEKNEQLRKDLYLEREVQRRVAGILGGAVQE